jgi:hypothetical protein
VVHYYILTKDNLKGVTMRINLAIDLTIDPASCPRNEVTETLENHVKHDVMNNILAQGPFFQTMKGPIIEYQFSNVEDLDSREGVVTNASE